MDQLTGRVILSSLAVNLAKICVPIQVKDLYLEHTIHNFQRLYYTTARERLREWREKAMQPFNSGMGQLETAG